MKIVAESQQHISYNNMKSRPSVSHPRASSYEHQMTQIVEFLLSLFSPLRTGCRAVQCVLVREEHSASSYPGVAWHGGRGVAWRAGCIRSLRLAAVMVCAACRPHRNVCTCRNKSPCHPPTPRLDSVASQRRARASPVRAACNDERKLTENSRGK